MEGCCSSPAVSSLFYTSSKPHTTTHGSTGNRHTQLFIPQILLSRCKKCVARKHFWSYFSFEKKKIRLQLRNGSGVKMTNGVLRENISQFPELPKQSNRFFQQCWQLFPITLNYLEFVIHPEKFARVERWRKKVKKEGFYFPYWISHCPCVHDVNLCKYQQKCSLGTY